MNVNGISSAYGAYNTYSSKSAVKAADTTAETKNTTVEEGVVYESGEQTVDRDALVAKLKEANEQRINQLRELVLSMMTTQAGKASTLADLYRNLTPDAATIKQAQEEISEDGYWGVNQTSDRIFEFAKALSGGEAEKMDDMLEAFKKGYKEATGAWGEELPEICGKTYDAVLEKFDAYKESLEA